jgi:hypothetical protein
MAALLQFHHSGEPPSLAEVLELFALDIADVDAQFGVVATDPGAGLFTVRVEDRALDKLRSALTLRPTHPAEGLFGDPRVEPLGPPGGS